MFALGEGQFFGRRRSLLIAQQGKKGLIAIVCFYTFSLFKIIDLITIAD